MLRHDPCQAMAHKVQEYRTAIHDIFAKHDADKSGFIEGDEKVTLRRDSPLTVRSRQLKCVFPIV